MCTGLQKLKQQKEGAAPQHSLTAKSLVKRCRKGSFDRTVNSRVLYLLSYDSKFQDWMKTLLFTKPLLWARALELKGLHVLAFGSTAAAGHIRGRLQQGKKKTKKIAERAIPMSSFVTP